MWLEFLECLFPEQMQAVHLRRLADGQSRERFSGIAPASSTEHLVEENRALRMYLTAVTQLLVEKGVIRIEELQGKVKSMLPPLPPVADAESETETNPFAGLDLDK